MKERGLRDNCRVFCRAVERMEDSEKSRLRMGKEKFGFGQTMFMVACGVCICVDELVSWEKSGLKIGFPCLSIICM